MIKILVTGGAGFIGSHTVVELFNAGFKPVIMDDFSNSDPSVLDGLKKILGHPVKCYSQDCNDAVALGGKLSVRNKLKELSILLLLSL